MIAQKASEGIATLLLNPRRLTIPRSLTITGFYASPSLVNEADNLSFRELHSKEERAVGGLFPARTFHVPRRQPGAQVVPRRQGWLCLPKLTPPSCDLHKDWVPTLSQVDRPAIAHPLRIGTHISLMPV